MSVSQPDTDATGYAGVAASLRKWIVEGELSPGAPLPKQTELAARFQVSGLTIWRAMRELQDDGFVVAMRRAGSFVAEAPPHLNRYALVLPDSPLAALQNRFMLALAGEAARLSEGSQLSIESYHGIGGNPEKGDGPRLNEDLARRRLAGIIFASPPFLLHGQPVLETPGLPRAAIMGDQDAYPHVAKVNLRVSDFADRALERLAGMGYRRIAAMVNASTLHEWERRLPELAATYGMEWRPEWLQGTGLQSAQCSRQIARLLFSVPPESRPDALVIGDDNLVEETTRGIAECGPEVSASVKVIAHCNFPWPVPASVPVLRLGFDAGELLEAALLALDYQRQGRGIPAYNAIGALFEDEYESRRHDPGKPTAEGTTNAYQST